MSEPQTREEVMERILEDFLIAILNATAEAQARITIDLHGYRWTPPAKTGEPK